MTRDSKQRRITRISYTIGAQRVDYYKVEYLIPSGKGFALWRGEVNFANLTQANAYISARQTVRLRERDVQPVANLHVNHAITGE